jgi:hypothetical protein
MNATLGTELPFTSFLNQTTIPLGYVDPPSEIIKNGQTQIWKITHNGVDTHFIHFHLFNVQVINRIGWDGTVRPPDFNEVGWKDTVRMNPLEITMVALQPIKPAPPWPVRDSYRLFDVTAPLGGTTQFTNVNPFTAAPANTPNAVYNFGWEYVWHCHILGHEENDMMRPIAFEVPPEAPANLAATWNPWGSSTSVNVSWTDMSASETGFDLWRANDVNFTQGLFQTSTPPSPPDINGQGTGWGGTITYTDTNPLTLGNTYYYEVRSFKPDSNYWNPPNVNLSSPWVVTTGTIQAATTATTIASSAAVTYGNAALVTVNVTSPQGGPVTGTVTLTITGPGAAPVSPITQSLSGNPGSTTFSVSNLAVGTYTLSAAYTPPFSWASPSTGAGTLVVNQAPLTITANASRAYGAANPAFTPTATGLVYGDTLASIGLTVTCTSTATPSSPVSGSPYPITCTGPASTTNYTITYSQGGLTITPALASVTPNAATKVYGTADPAFAGTLSGFLAADGITAAYNRTPGETVAGGPYTISATLSPAAALTNYTITYNTAPFTITPAAASVTPAAASKTYGTADPVPLTTATLTGFLPTDNVTAAFTRTPGETVTGGPYTISATLAPATVLGNYTITYNTAPFAITAAAASVTPNAATKAYGAADPVLTGTLAGFLPADGVTASYSRTPGETVAGSPYTISATLAPAGVLSNYKVTYNAAQFTITPAIASVTPNPATKVYGTADPALTGTLAGFLAADGVTATYSRTPGETVAGSPYPISAVLAPAGVLSNYTVAYNTAPFTITPSTPTVTFTGAPASAAFHSTFTVAATSNSTSTAVITASGACSVAGTMVTMTSGTGICSLTANWAADSNYTSATATQSTTATLLAPTASFTGAPASAAFNNSFTLVATTNASTTPVLTVAGPCSIGGSTVTMTGGTGTCNMSAQWAADANYSGVTLTQSTTATKIAPTVTFTGAPASAVYTTTFTVASTTNASTTAVITPSGGCSIAGNTVTMTSGTTACSLTANWAADNNYNAATASQSTAAQKAASASSITSNVPNPSNVAQAVTVSFTVTGNGSPTGSVTVNATTGESCTGSLTLGVGSCAITFNTSGTRILTAAYSGDANFAGATSAGVSQTVNAAGASVSPSSLVYANQLVNSTSPAQPATLTNTGTTTLTNIVVTLAGTDFTLTNGCGSTLAAGRNCTLTVRFRPASSGAKTGTVTIASSAPTLTVSLSGTGIAPINSVSPTSLTFSSPLNVTSAAQTVTVTNTGTASLTINNITRNGANANQFAQTNNCGGTFPATLPVGASCTINVTFRPTAGTPVTKTANLNVTVASPATSVTVPLTGTVVVPTYTVSPTTINFGNQTIRTTSAPQTVTVTNTGTAALIINNITRTGANANQFAQTNTCPIGGAGLAGGSSCTVNATFTPTTRGAKSASLNVNVASPATSTSVSLSGTGQ